MVAQANRPKAGAINVTSGGRRLIGERLTRSENMSRIRGKDTGPEMTVRRAVWQAGLRYRLHDKRLPGKPDLVFSRLRTVVFVHGCFWHCHEGCKNSRVPKTRSDWWMNKLAGNKVRDMKASNCLRNMGWDVLVIWECEAANPKRVSDLIGTLQQRSSRSKIHSH
jgi:DNA mismatch endonuclease (patch repair protein)